MQNDLISRSALIKYLRDYKWEFALESDFSKAIEMVDVQPTAYNVEKVVEDVRIDCCAMGFDDSQIEIILKDVRNGGKE